MSDKDKYQYSGKQVDVEWDGRLCIHIAECGLAKGDLFVGGRQPWCVPDLVPLEDVIDVVERCPSGALTYTVKDGSTMESPDNENTVLVAYNGPYFVRGSLDIEDIPKDMPSVSYRAALCRCGQTKNRPFCDNSHESANFRDYGAVGDKGDDITDKGGILNIKPLKDGPLLLTGNVIIKASSGRDRCKSKNVALCRCGASKNKPFCDGSHQKAGFKTE